MLAIQVFEDGIRSVEEKQTFRTECCKSFNPQQTVKPISNRKFSISSVFCVCARIVHALFYNMDFVFGTR